MRYAKRSILSLAIGITEPLSHMHIGVYHAAGGQSLFIWRYFMGGKKVSNG